MPRIASRMPLRRWTEGSWCTFDQSRAQLFARALGEHDSRLLAGTQLCETFAILPAWQTQESVVDTAFGSEAMAHGVHGEQRFEFVRPMEADSDVRSRSRIVGVRHREKGTLLAISSEVLDRQGVLNRQQEIIFALGVWLEPQRTVGAGEDLHVPEQGDFASSDFEGIWNATKSQITLYANASGDHFKVHTDVDYAQSLGYSSTIMHGMCTMGVATRSVRECVQRYGEVRLAALGVRFRAPVTPPAQLLTRVAIHDVTPTELSGRYETIDLEKNLVVLSQGYFLGKLPHRFVP